MATVRIQTKARKSGAALTLAGLLAVVVSFFFGGPASSAEAGTSPVCNNQHGNASDCQDSSYHGHVDWAFQANGDLTFHVVGENGWQWSGLFVCIPYAGPTQGADCTGSDNPLVPGTDYTVTDVSGLSNGSTNASFNCDGDFSATVNASAIEDIADPVSWALHFSACNGGTDEAFGTSTHAQGTTTTTAAPTTTTTVAPTTTTTSTTVAPTTTTTEPEEGTTTTTTEAPTTTTVADNPTTTTVAVQGSIVTSPQVQGAAVQADALAATGSDTKAHVALAGLALILGGVVVMFGERSKRAATR